MPQSLQVKVGVVGDTSKIKQQIKDLQADMLKVDVSVDTAQAEKKLNALVQKYNAKKITLDVDVGTGKNSGKNSIVSNLTKQLNSAEKQLYSFSEKAAKALSSGKINQPAYDDLKKRITEAEHQFSSLRQESNLTANDLSKLADVQRQLDQAFSKAKIQNTLDAVNGSTDTFSKNIDAMESKVKRMRDTFERWVMSNARVSQSASGDLQNLRNQFTNILSDLSNKKNVDPGVIRQLGDDISAFKTKAQEAGMTGTTAFGRFSSKVKELGTYLMTSHLFMTFINGAQMVVQNVREIDSAMTELRKVTDASNARFAQSFDTAASSAQQYGMKVSEIIQATADWSRLGYSLDQAERLAQVTALYKNVGDNMEMETASQSLISTLQGFQLTADQAESVIDKFNEVSNNYAISSEDIGIALQRSAASFNVANTDLSQAIALVTGTQEVVQDSSRVGNMWKTKFCLYVQKCA